MPQAAPPSNPLPSLRSAVWECCGVGEGNAPPIPSEPTLSGDTTSPPYLEMHLTHVSTSASSLRAQVSLAGFAGVLAFPTLVSHMLLEAPAVSAQIRRCCHASQVPTGTQLPDRPISTNKLVRSCSTFLLESS